MNRLLIGVIAGGYIPPYVSPLILSWYNSLAVKPSPALLTDLNTMVDTLDSLGIWTLLDLFHPIGGMETNEQRIKPLRTTSGFNFSIPNGGTLNNTGFTGNGTNQFIDTFWSPGSDGINYQEENASYGVYIRTNVDENRVDIGTSDSGFILTQLISRFSNLVSGSINIDSATGVPATFAMLDSRGFTVVKRTLADQTIFKNGASIVTNSDGVVGSSFNSFYVGALNDLGSGTSFSTKNISLVFAGSDTIVQSDLYTVIQIYMTSRGINV